jgi:hypothetical protein
MTEQVPTQAVSLTDIMGSLAFVAGTREVRGGLPLRTAAYSKVNDQWNYERGRAWAVVAPRNMPLWVGGSLNPAAMIIGHEVIL